ncbi:MAG TPA: tetratricopeptide repeat protein [Phycisphaerales bacterium]|nr:tetratricopeptide repeat protein [Phycisphaerales bacterium]
MNKYLVIAVYIGLILITLLVFWQVRNFDFVHFDDNDYVYENQHVLDGLTWDGVIWAFTSGHASNWHPVTWLSLMLDCQMFGKDPGRMHLVNVFLHLANTLLLFAVLRKMTSSLWPSAFVAAAFAIHPMHVESVAWIAERKDVLSTLFWLLTMAAYAGFVKRPSVFRYTMALVLFAVGLMAKPMLVTLPFVLLLLDYWPLNRLEVTEPLPISGRRRRKATPPPRRRPVWYRLIIEKIPFLALAAVSSVITFFVQRSGGAMSTSDVLPLKGRVGNASISYFQYIKKMVWPSKLAAFYPHPSSDIHAAKAVVCILLLIGLTVLFLYLARRRKYLATGWLWYLGTLLPVIGLIQVGGQAYADRYTYIPFIGLFMMIAWGAAELLARFPHRKFVLGLFAAIILTPMGLYSHRQVGFWKNGVALFSHAIEVTLNNAIAYNGLSLAYFELGNFKEAIEALEHVVQTKPNDALTKNNLSWFLATASDPKLRNPAKAVDLAEKACELAGHKNTAFFDTLAAAYASADRFDEAVSTAEKALKRAEAAGNENLTQEIKGHLKLFRQGRSYSEQINN